jgi:hypothetical protein
MFAFVPGPQQFVDENLAALKLLVKRKLAPGFL